MGAQILGRSCCIIAVTMLMNDFFNQFMFEIIFNHLYST